MEENNPNKMNDFKCHYCLKVIAKTNGQTLYFVFGNMIVGQVSVKKGRTLFVYCDDCNTPEKQDKGTIWLPVR